MKQKNPPHWCKHIRWIGDQYAYIDPVPKQSLQFRGYADVYRWKCCPICQVKPPWDK